MLATEFARLRASSYSITARRSIGGLGRDITTATDDDLRMLGEGVLGRIKYLKSKTATLRGQISVSEFKNRRKATDLVALF